MAAAFLAMNEVHGPLYAVSRAGAQQPDTAVARAAPLKNQFIMDVRTHFLHPDKGRQGLAADQLRQLPFRLSLGGRWCGHGR